MPVDTYAISGTALVYVGTGADLSASSQVMQLLGYTEAGVDMDITENKTEIMTDLFGDKTPQDFQDMGMIARMVIPLIAYDSAVLTSIQGRGNRSTWGSLNTPGIPLFQPSSTAVNGYGFPMYIACPLASALPGSAFTPTTPAVANPVWYFYNCLLKTSGQRLATKANPFRIELLANPWKSYTATTGKDAPLWRRSII